MEGQKVKKVTKFKKGKERKKIEMRWNATKNKERKKNREGEKENTFARKREKWKTEQKVDSRN